MWYMIIMMLSACAFTVKATYDYHHLYPGRHYMTEEFFLKICAAAGIAIVWPIGWSVLIGKYLITREKRMLTDKEAELRERELQLREMEAADRIIAQDDQEKFKPKRVIGRKIVQ